MNILSKALERFRKKPEPLTPVDEADEAHLNASIDSSSSGQEMPPEDVLSSDVDKSALDKEVADGENKESEVAYAADTIHLADLDLDNLDVDLGADITDITNMPRDNMLEINLSRPFSHPVDLDLQALSSKGFLIPTNANTHLSNSFRMIKRPLLNNAVGKGATVVDRANLIMMTSSVASEGKSFSAINLAMSIAMEKNKRVLLIDADVNKPSHHNIFGVEMEFGLTDYLSGKVKDMSRVMCSTNVPSLSLMFAGNMTSHATELLASEAMENFARDISQRYPDRIIIFDSPPLLMTTEASVLASHMGQIVMVVEAEKTARQEVRKSLNLLSNEIILLLLNKMREKDEAANYGYYGYGYGHQS